MSLKPPGRLIDVGGFRLHFHAMGAPARPTVVLDAALAGTAISWCRVQPEVARFARVCAYDRAGLGWSEAGPLPRTAGRLAGELHTLLERAGEVPPYLLVGHSFGGLVLRVFAARWPEKTAALVLIDPAHPEDWVHPAPKEQALLDRGARLCRQGSRLARMGVARVVAGLAGLGALRPAWALVTAVTGGALTVRDEGILAPMWKLPVEARRPLRRFWTQSKFFDALGSQIAAMPVSAADVLSAAPSGYGDLPLVTISSTDPGEHRLRQQEALARLSTRGRHLVASASGHWIPLDQPELVAHVIREVWTNARHLGMRPH
jgi:pimeloyl-ACP methyl ester carboxylesterase